MMKNLERKVLRWLEMSINGSSTEDMPSVRTTRELQPHVLMNL
jgi:hypothetical protein